MVILYQIWDILDYKFKYRNILKLIVPKFHVMFFSLCIFKIPFKVYKKL